MVLCREGREKLLKAPQYYLSVTAGTEPNAGKLLTSMERVAFRSYFSLALTSLKGHTV